MTEENHTPRDLERLKSDAADTRQRLADDVDAIGAKVSPANLKKEAKEAVTDMGRKAVSEVQSVAQEAVNQTQKFSASFTQVVRENPIPAVMVGAGLGWLVYRAATRSRPKQSAYGASIYNQSSFGESNYNPSTGGAYGASTAGGFAQSTKEAFSEARHKLEGAAGDVKQKTLDVAQNAQRHARELGDQARHQASDMGHQIEHSYQENPLLFGAVTIGAGLALGLVLPRTRVEDQLVGEQRDNLVDQVKHKAEAKAKELERSATSKTQSYIQKKNGDGDSVAGGSHISDRTP